MNFSQLTTQNPQTTLGELSLLTCDTCGKQETYKLEHHHLTNETLCEECYTDLDEDLVFSPHTDMRPQIKSHYKPDGSQENLMATAVSVQVVNQDRLQSFIADKDQLGDCWPSSLLMWWKMRKIGASRMRGKRNIEQTINDPDNQYHYWVENKGLVFEEMSGIRRIIPKDEYYRINKIVEAEAAEACGIHTDEYPKADRKLMRNLDERQLINIVVGMLRKYGRTDAEILFDLNITKKNK